MKAEIDCTKEVRIIRTGGEYEPFLLVVTRQAEAETTTRTSAAHGIEDLLALVREIMESK
jgi:hypothetical protein